MSNKKIFFVLWLSSSLLLFNRSGMAQSNAPTYLTEAQKEIEKNDLNYFKAFSRKDSSLFNSLYTFDCWIMAPGIRIFCGPDAASDFFQYASKNTSIRNGKFISINVYGISQDMIAEVGFYQLFNAENLQIDDGKYIVLWKKTDNAWKRFRDSFSSSRKSN